MSTASSRRKPVFTADDWRCWQVLPGFLQQHARARLCPTGGLRSVSAAFAQTQTAVAGRLADIVEGQTRVVSVRVKMNAVRGR